MYEWNDLRPISDCQHIVNLGNSKHLHNALFSMVPSLMHNERKKRKQQHVPGGQR
jgi:hypothetical protein